MLRATSRGLVLLLSTLSVASCRGGPSGTVVYQSDFGLADGAVSAMKGVARGVDPALVIEDLTHEIRPFDIWQGAYRLYQTAPYWPEGTVFVSVVDPGVGTPRKSIVARSGAGHLFVTPDNGTLTLIGSRVGIEAVRWIDESKLRLPGSHTSHTFHGRDVYSYVGALLASGKLDFDDVGATIDPADLERLPYREARTEERNGRTWMIGMIPVLDPNFGNVWTDLPTEALDTSRPHTTGAPSPHSILVRITHEGRVVFEEALGYLSTFGEVARGEPLAYRNSLGNLAFALNQGSFAERFHVGSGTAWQVEVRLPD